MSAADGAPPPATRLADLMTPGSIAIVGASDDPRRIGGRPVSHMINQRFPGAVYPVNPKRERVQGLPAYPSLADVPGQVDFVLVAVPAASVPEVMRQAVTKRAKTALIFSSNFAEASPQGAGLQEEVATIAREGGVRVIGPNCLGLFDSAHGFYPTFSSTIDRATPDPGGVAIASQSGAYGSHIYMVSHMRGLAMRYWLTTGNEADVHVAEAIKLMAEDESVHTIMAYAESIKDGPLLVEALETARAEKKPVIFMKVGRSEVGAAAASSHTASLAGEDAVYDAVLARHGAWRARSTEEMLDIAYAARPRIYPAGRKVGLVTISGGAGVLMADAAADHGLDVAPMPAAAQAELKELVPFASPANPVDVTAQFFNDLSIVPRFTRAMLDVGGYDGLIGFWTSVAGSPLLAEPLLAGLKEAMAGRENLFIHSVIASDEIRQGYEAEGFPCFEDPTRAITAMAALMHYGAAFAEPAPAVPLLPDLPPLPEGPLGEREAKALFAAAGLPVVTDTLARTAAEAEAAVHACGGAAALKIASADILHKSDAGGVALGVTAEEAAGRFEAIMAACRAHAPAARIDGVLVSPMIGAGVDCILGARTDPVFGPVVVFGLGGIFTEILGDVAFRRAPFGTDDAHAMIDALKGRALLEGARGTEPVDRAALAEAIARFSGVAAALGERVESLEMNPLRAMAPSEGGGCIALDALIVKKESAP
ncbi:MAG: acetate--CoA ligase family protein [Pseudomonadota bacterium]